MAKLEKYYKDLAAAKAAKEASVKKNSAGLKRDEKYFKDAIPDTLGSITTNIEKTGYPLKTAIAGYSIVFYSAEDYNSFLKVVFNNLSEKALKIVKAHKEALSDYDILDAIQNYYEKVDFGTDVVSASKTANFDKAAKYQDLVVDGGSYLILPDGNIIDRNENIVANTEGIDMKNTFQAGIEIANRIHASKRN